MFNLNTFSQVPESKSNDGSAIDSKTVNAQVAPAIPPAPTEPVQTTQYFPVKDAGDLAAKFMDKLLSDDQNVYSSTVSYILSQVRGEIQEQDIKGILEGFWNLNSNDQGKALQLFGNLYELLPAKLKTQPNIQQGTFAMSENPKGIIKYNLSEFVLNNQKTAAAHFGHEYMLYGPTEKRICPKLSGKNMGNVVSEYVCRHHCLDGIVIDDNKTICGEALWRANAMDKYSSEYVDADGNIVGGYLNKRFETNRNVPEENKMRLKPGETRKPRPANMGSLESRMQDMRNKEADKRGFRPNPDKTKPFNWTKDVDQNNMGIEQATRDTREEDAGHVTVDHVSEKNLEIKPRTASFNLSKFKTAQHYRLDQFGEEPSEFGQDMFDDSDGFQGPEEDPEHQYTIVDNYYDEINNAVEQMDLKVIDSILQKAQQSATSGQMTPDELAQIQQYAEQERTRASGRDPTDMYDAAHDDAPMYDDDRHGPHDDFYGDSPDFDIYAKSNPETYQYKFSQVYETGLNPGSDADIPENPNAVNPNVVPENAPTCKHCFNLGKPSPDGSGYTCTGCGLPITQSDSQFANVAAAYVVDFTKLAETNSEAELLKKK